MLAVVTSVTVAEGGYIPAPQWVLPYPFLVALTFFMTPIRFLTSSVNLQRL